MGEEPEHKGHHQHEHHGFMAEEHEHGGRGFRSMSQMSSPSMISAASSEGGGDRAQWDKQLEFILSCIGYAVGLGNLTRFPYICGRNGGGAFLIPYFIMLFLSGIPTFYMELNLGQFCQVTPYYAYRRMAPMFRGLGYAMICVSMFTAAYYNVYMAWAFIYFGDTFVYTVQGEELPYKGCTHDWNTELCFDKDVYDVCVANATDPLLYYDGRCWPQDTFNATSDPSYDHVVNLTNKLIGGGGVSSSQQYNNYRLNTGQDPTAPVFEDWGAPTWQLIVGSFASWFVVFLILIKGVHSVGKVMYFTAIFPYVVLAALCIQGNLLEGSYLGIEFYIVPNFTQLASSQVWVDAASQVFFSTSVASGGLATLSSYNNFNSNTRRDTFIVTIGNAASSIFAGFVIFPLLGFQAQRLNTDVATLAKGGPALAFVAYPGALAELTDVPWLWALLFLFMLLLLGLDSEVVMVEVVLTAVSDVFPALRATKTRKALFTGGMCLIYFLVGMVMLTPSGPQLVNLLDTFAGGWPLLVTGCVELILVAWVYGVKRYLGDITMMLGVPESSCGRAAASLMNVYVTSTWCIITPIILLASIVANFLFFSFDYNGLPYPHWGYTLGWSIAGFCLFWIPLFWLMQPLFACFKRKSAGWLVKPTSDWGPANKVLKRRIAVEHPVYGVEKMSLTDIIFSHPRKQFSGEPLRSGEAAKVNGLPPTNEASNAAFEPDKTLPADEHGFDSKPLKF